jgi:hypothetical protein
VLSIGCIRCASPPIAGARAADASVATATINTKYCTRHDPILTDVQVLRLLWLLRSMRDQRAADLWVASQLRRQHQKSQCRFASVLTAHGRYHRDGCKRHQSGAEVRTYNSQARWYDIGSKFLHLTNRWYYLSPYYTMGCCVCVRRAPMVNSVHARVTSQHQVWPQPLAMFVTRGSQDTCREHM